MMSTFLQKCLVLCSICILLLASWTHASGPSGDQDTQIGQVPLKNISLTIFDDLDFRGLDFNRGREGDYDEGDKAGNACSLDKDKGTCTSNEGRYYFSKRSGYCKRFRYSGCGGNENNFTSRRSCERKCGRKSRRHHGGRGGGGSRRRGYPAAYDYDRTEYAYDDFYNDRGYAFYDRYYD